MQITLSNYTRPPKQICYKGPMVGISCVNARNKKNAYVSGNIKDVTCFACRVNIEIKKPLIIARTIKKEDHGTFRAAKMANCDCADCKTYLIRKREINKIKYSLAKEYECSEKEIVDFLNAKIFAENEETDSRNIDLWIYHKTRFRSAILRLFPKS